ncbi:MAG: hypothetical protein M1837_006699 [Sclerophora amabilis]|nr:MAG: hypothetical protein M1837_006699 [Sclerophora amabilis]
MASTESGPPSLPQQEKRKLKILMLHGFQQSGPLFHAKTRALEKTLQKAFPPSPSRGHLPAYPGGVSLIYPTGPIKLRATDLPPSSTTTTTATSTAAPSEEQPDAYGWWIRNAETGEYTHFEQGLATIADTLRREGDVAGVIGFSQGAGAAAIVASLLEEGRREAFVAAGPASKADGRRPVMAFPESFLLGAGVGAEGKGEGKGEGLIHPPLKFGVIYSGMAADGTALYRALYQPKIRTPLLHFVGSLDVLVEEARSLRLVDSCVAWGQRQREGDLGRPGVQEGRDADVDVEEEEEERNGRVVYHPGGHFLPTQKQYLATVIGFIREIVGREGVTAEE